MMAGPVCTVLWEAGARKSDGHHGLVWVDDRAHGPGVSLSGPDGDGVGNGVALWNVLDAWVLHHELEALLGIVADHPMKHGCRAAAALEGWHADHVEQVDEAHGVH